MTENINSIKNLLLLSYLNIENLEYFEDSFLNQSFDSVEIFYKAIQEKIFFEDISGVDYAFFKVQKILTQMEKGDYYLISYKSKNYPKALNKLDKKPKFLFCKGDITCLNKPIIAIVGTRKSSKEGENIAYKISQKLSSDYIILSGLAKGIDTKAHLGAVDLNNKTIAVLPSPINKIYPKENSYLASRIVENRGLLLSPFMPEINIKKYFFIYRDKIQAALSDKIYIIEMGLKSGTMHTLRAAEKFNKKIYIYDWDEVKISNLGNHKLIDVNIGEKFKII